MSIIDDPNDRPGRVWTVQGYLLRPVRRFTPPTDIIEMDERIVVLVEIAGMTSDNFKIALHNQTLTISGVRQRPQLEATAYHRAEIGFGEFRVSMPMPWSVMEDSVTANYRRGFLRVELPRQQSQHIHIVDVHTSED